MTLAEKISRIAHFPPSPLPELSKSTSLSGRIFETSFTRP